MSKTYIHNWSLKPFSQDYDLASHTTHIVCVNFIHEWRVVLPAAGLEKVQKVCQKSAILNKKSAKTLKPDIKEITKKLTAFFIINVFFFN